MVEILLFIIAAPFIMLALAPIALALSFIFGLVYYTVYGIGMLIYALGVMAMDVISENRNIT